MYRLVFLFVELEYNQSVSFLCLTLVKNFLVSPAFALCLLCSCQCACARLDSATSYPVQCRFCCIAHIGRHACSIGWHAFKG